jgi:hypothetical protein
MAFTIDSTTMRSVGNAFRVSGTYESVNSGSPQEDILDRNEDDDDVAVPFIRINQSDTSSTVDNGSIAHIDSVAGDTIHWTADFIM